MSETPPPPDGLGPSRVSEPDRPPPPAGDWPLATSPTPTAAAGRGAVARTQGRGTREFPGAAGIGLSFGAIAVYLGGQLLLQLVIGLGLVGTGLIGPELLDLQEGGSSVLGLVIASQTVGLILAVALVRWRGVPLRPLVGALQPTGRLIGKGLALGFLAILGSSLIVSLLVSLTGSEATPEQVLTDGLADDPLRLVLAIIAAVVLAPVAEEFLFRGLLHRGLRRRLSLLPAAAVSSVVFAVVHVDVLFSQPLAIVGLVLVGVILALAYERTGSLFVPIMIHAVHNAVTIVAVVVTGRFGLGVAAPAVGILRFFA